MKPSALKSACAFVLMTASLIGGVPAAASSEHSGGKTDVAKAKKKTAGTGQVRFLPGSGETTRERSTRLKRECKGGVNAGACAGYTG
ncbi:MAG: hypothetical protein JWR68_484 [Polaromonas sp.]|nr:hypothetical protein [Polaromonas sp.]